MALDDLIAAYSSERTLETRGVLADCLDDRGECDLAYGVRHGIFGSFYEVDLTSMICGKVIATLDWVDPDGNLRAIEGTADNFHEAVRRMLIYPSRSEYRPTNA
jgi:hypothetical protein